MCLVKNDEVIAAGSEIWVKRDGTKVPVKDMSDAYVRNAFTSLLKKIREKSEGRIDEDEKTSVALEPAASAE